jgi:hypothetical protein
MGLAVTLGLLWFGAAGASGIKNFRMSDAPGGPALDDFPSGTETLYVVFDYLDLAEETIRVRVHTYAGAVLLDQTNPYIGSDTASIAIPTGPFPDGPYVTTLYFAGGYLSTALEWTVGGTNQPPTPTPLSPTTLQVAPTHLAIQIPEEDPSPLAQKVMISNGGGGLLIWSASTDAHWLRIHPSSGAAPALLRVSAHMDDLPAGVYEGHITISGEETVLGSPQIVSVTLTISPPESGTTIVPPSSGK